MKDTLKNRINNLSIAIDELCTLLYQQNINEGIGKLGLLLQEIEDIINLIKFRDEETKNEAINLFNTLFKNIIDDIENNDAIRLADTVRYELLENLKLYSNII